MRFGTLWYYIFIGGGRWASFLMVTVVQQSLLEKLMAGHAHGVVTCAKKALIGWMLWTRSIHFEPFVDTSLVVNAEAGQAGDGVPLCELLQADGTLARILRQDVLIVCDSRLC